MKGKFQQQESPHAHTVIFLTGKKAPTETVIWKKIDEIALVFLVG